MEDFGGDGIDKSEMSRVALSAVIAAYNQCTETGKREFARRVLEADGDLFSQWINRASNNMRGVNRAKWAGRSDGRGARLDGYFRRAPPNFVIALLRRGFAGTAYRPNEDFLARMRRAGVSEEAGDARLAEQIIKELRREFELDPLYALWEAGLRLSTPMWWGDTSMRTQPSGPEATSGPMVTQVPSATPHAAGPEAAHRVDCADDASAEPWTPPGTPRPEEPPMTDTSSTSSSGAPNSVPCEAQQLDQLLHDAASLEGQLAQLGANWDAIFSGAADLGQVAGLADAAAELAGQVSRLDEARQFAACAPSCPGFRDECRSLASFAGERRRDANGLHAHVVSLRSLRSRLDEVRKRTGDLEAELFTLAQELNVETRAAPVCTSVRAGAAAISELERLREEWLAAHLAQLESMRRGLLEQLKEAHAAFGWDEIQAKELDTLMAEVNTSSRLSQLRELGSRLRLRSSSWRRGRSTAELAGEALTHLRLDRLSELGENLLKINQPESALVLLCTAQQAESEDLLADGDGAHFMQTFASALAATALSDLKNIEPLIPGLLLEGWLRKIRREDLGPEAHSSRPLVLLLLAVARHRDDALPVCHAFRAFETFSEHPALSLVASAILEKRAWRIARNDPAKDEAEARARAQATLDAPFAAVLRKAHSANRFGVALQSIKETLTEEWRHALENGRMEKAQVEARLKPRIESAWKRVDEVLHGDRSERFFREKIEAALDQTLRDFYHFVDTRSASRGGSYVTEAAIDAELAQLTQQNPDGTLTYRLAKHLLSRTTLLVPTQHTSALGGALLRSRGCATAAPALAAAASLDPTWIPERTKSLVVVLEHLHAPDDRAAKQALVDAACLDVLHPAEEGNGEGPAAAERQAIQRAIEKIDDTRDGGAERLRLERSLQLGHYGYVRSELRRLAAAQEHELASVSMKTQAELKAMRSRFNELVSEVDEGPFDKEWRSQLAALRGQIDSTFQQALPPDQTISEKRRAIELLTPVIAQLDAMIHYDGNDFTALRDLVAAISIAPRPQVDVGELSIGEGWSFGESRVTFWKYFMQLASKKGPPANSSDVEHLGALAQLLRMYKPGQERPDVHAYRISGLQQQGLLTKFFKAGASYFHRPICLVLLRGGTATSAEGEAIERDMQRTTSTREHYVLLVSANAEDFRRKLRKRAGEGRVTFVDRAQLKTLLEAENIAPRFRQLMRRAMSVEVVSPYRSEGHVSADENIYVGREDVLNQLTSGKSFALWAGRRSGKTSLLHAAQRVFQEQEKHALVVYESAQGLSLAPTTPLESLDLQLATRLAHSLKLGAPPESLEDFRARLDDACVRQPIVLLLDEIDEYVAPYLERRQFEFRLIDHLRALRNKHGERFRPIFAGFKYLFEAVELVRRHEDPGYPWQNFVSKLAPLSSLSLDETTELLKEGFSEILGFEYEPTVPQLIFAKTGGHPALVQHFADAVLRRIANSARSDPSRKITAADVEDTFAESVMDPAHMPYIAFVGQTLDMNLGNLERIVIYVLAAECIGKNGDGAAEFDRSDIERAVNGWFGSKPPSTEEFDRAFGNLKMTKMLVGSDVRFRIAFPSYAQILLRLEEATKDRIEKLVIEHRKQGSAR